MKQKHFLDFFMLALRRPKNLANPAGKPDIFDPPGMPVA